MKQGKIWGETEEVFNNGIVSVHHLKIKKGGYCSIHKHIFKSNTFHVIYGNLSLKIWRNDENPDETVVWAGEQSEIEPGVYHQFRGLTDVDCIEICEAKLRGEDIERKSQGGIKNG